jgi:hypothetical protein
MCKTGLSAPDLRAPFARVRRGKALTQLAGDGTLGAA